MSRGSCGVRKRTRSGYRASTGLSPDASQRHNRLIFKTAAGCSARRAPVERPTASSASSVRAPAAKRPKKDTRHATPTSESGAGRGGTGAHPCSRRALVPGGPFGRYCPDRPWPVSFRGRSGSRTRRIAVKRRYQDRRVHGQWKAEVPRRARPPLNGCAKLASCLPKRRAGAVPIR